MSVVLAIERDPAQAEILREVLRGRVGADLVVVTSKAAAIAAIERQGVPDLILVTALLTPRDEEALNAHLRGIENAGHLQTLTIPQLRRPDEKPEKKSRFFGGKKKGAASSGADPAVFADEVATYLARARQTRKDAQLQQSDVVHDAVELEKRPPVPAFLAEPPADVEHHADLWNPYKAPAAAAPAEPVPAAAPVEDDPVASEIDKLIERLGVASDVAIEVETPFIVEPSAPPLATADALLAAPALHDPPKQNIFDDDEDEGDEIELDAALDIVQIEAENEKRRIAQETEARLAAENEKRLSAEMARLREETEARRAEELARVHQQAEAERQRAVEAARAAAEADARERLEAEQARAAEAERARQEAEERRLAEIARLQKEAEEARLRADAEAARQREAEEARRQAEEARREAEAAKQREIEEARRQAEEARRAAEAEKQREIEEARRQAEEARRQAEAEKQREIEEARRKAEAEKRRELEEARRQAEEARRAAEAEKQRVIEEARRQAEEAKQAAEAAKQREIEEARRAAAAAKQREIEEARRAAEAAKAAAEKEARDRKAAEEALAAELERVRQEAETRRAAELARLQEEAEAMRRRAIEETRAAAEAEAREALAAELARVRAEAESQIARVQGEAEHAFAQELGDVRAEAERALASQLERARAEEEAARQAERARALEDEVARVREESEARLRAELDRVRAEAEHARMTDQAELDRIRREADERLNTEMAALRADAERKRSAELDAIRSQVMAVREAAAQQARAAAAEAVAAERARSQASAPGPIKVSKLTPDFGPMMEPPEAEGAAAQAENYYELWRDEPQGAKQAPAAPAPKRARPFPITIDRKYVVPIAASLVVIVGGVTVGGRVVAMVKHAWASVPSAAAGAPKEPAAPIEPPKRKDVGELFVQTNPSGARVLVDGKERGESPLTVGELKPGKHKVVIETPEGTVRREVTIRGGDRSILDEAIMAGWLAVYSRIPLDVMIGGKRIASTEDGQILLAPGRHKVTLASAQYSYRETVTVEIDSGKVESFNVKLPQGRVNVDAPQGTEVWIEGEQVASGQLQDIAVPIGTREVVMRHPSFGEHREFVEVRRGASTLVTPRPTTGLTGAPRLLPLSRPKAKIGG